MIKRYAFIFLGKTRDPADARVVIELEDYRATIVAAPTHDAAVKMAVELADAGVDLIELCGIFGPVWTARVLEAIGGHVPVGSVGFGPESVPMLAARMSTALE